jgi:hypothetical protein
MQNTNSKTTLYLVGVVVALAILGWLFFSFSSPKSPIVPVNDNQGQVSNNQTSTVVAPDQATVTKNKSEIMSLVAKNRVLTAEEKAKILAALNGELISYYKFTEQDKKAIIDALNRK